MQEIKKGCFEGNIFIIWWFNQMTKIEAIKIEVTHWLIFSSYWGISYHEVVEPYPLPPVPPKQKTNTKGEQKAMEIAEPWVIMYGSITNIISLGDYYRKTLAKTIIYSAFALGSPYTFWRGKGGWLVLLRTIFVSQNLTSLFPPNMKLLLHCFSRCKKWSNIY